MIVIEPTAQVLSSAVVCKQKISDVQRGSDQAYRILDQLISLERG